MVYPEIEFFVIFVPFAARNQPSLIALFSQAEISRLLVFTTVAM
jgi:hypothetical protein